MTYHNAHAARIEDGIVREVIVIPYCNDDDAEITAYCNGIGLSGARARANGLTRSYNRVYRLF
jgi:hypothetical protein